MRRLAATEDSRAAVTRPFSLGRRLRPGLGTDVIFPELIIRLLRRRLLPEGERRQLHLPGSGLPGWRRAIDHEHGCAGRNVKDVQAGGINWAEVRRVYEAGEVPLSAV